MLIDLAGILKRYPLLQVKGVAHVGACQCEESAKYKSLGIDDVVWFEANPHLVKEQTAKGHKVYECAASDRDGDDVCFNVTSNGQSSSLLELDLHATFYPTITVVQRISVTTARLDAFGAKHKLDWSKYNFLVVDVQGADLKVIKGLGSAIEHFDAVFVEVNVAPLYEGCDLLGAMDSFLLKCGFERAETEMVDQYWGDALYLRPKFFAGHVPVKQLWTDRNSRAYQFFPTSPVAGIELEATKASDANLLLNYDGGCYEVSLGSKQTLLKRQAGGASVLIVDGAFDDETHRVCIERSSSSSTEEQVDIKVDGQLRLRIRDDLLKEITSVGIDRGRWTVLSDKAAQGWRLHTSYNDERYYEIPQAAWTPTEVSLAVESPSDGCVLTKFEDGSEMEWVVGGWKNTQSAVRQVQEGELMGKSTTVLHAGFNAIQIKLQGDKWVCLVDNKEILSQPAKCKKISVVYVHTGWGSGGVWSNPITTTTPASAATTTTTTTVAAKKSGGTVYYDLKTDIGEGLAHYLLASVLADAWGKALVQVYGDGDIKKSDCDAAVVTPAAATKLEMSSDSVHIAADDDAAAFDAWEFLQKHKAFCSSRFNGDNQSVIATDGTRVCDLVGDDVTNADVVMDTGGDIGLYKLALTKFDPKQITVALDGGESKDCVRAICGLLSGKNIELVMGDEATPVAAFHCMLGAKTLIVSRSSSARLAALLGTAKTVYGLH